MKCFQCGQELAGDAVFCNRCGTRAQGAGPGQPFAASGYPPPAWQAAPAGGTASVAAAYLIPKEEMQRRRIGSHLQALGITWCLWGVYRVVGGVAASLALHTLSLHGSWPGDNMNFLPGLFRHLVPLVAMTTALMATLSLLTGYGLLTLKPWARTLAIIMAILSLIKIPLGTALGIYTLWVLAPRAGGLEYERRSQNVTA